MMLFCLPGLNEKNAYFFSFVSFFVIGFLIYHLELLELLEPPLFMRLLRFQVIKIYLELLEPLFSNNLIKVICFTSYLVFCLIAITPHGKPASLLQR